MSKKPVFWLLISLAGIAILTALGPAEKTLGTNVRVVYLHGAWVWAALAGFLLAGLAGLVGLLTRRDTFHHWSRALGRTGLLFWVTYIPISMWAMETNWNGLFLAEPRFRLAVAFAIGGLLLQIGLVLMEDPIWASLGNLLYVIALFSALLTTPDVMHPPAPILTSDAPRIQVFFAALFLFTLFAAWQVARWWYRRETTPVLSE